MVRVVLDTNVVVSAALKPTGNERMAIEAIGVSRSILLLSPNLLAEYREVIARRKFRRVRAELEVLVAALAWAAFHVKPGTVPRVSRDVADKT